MRLFQALGFMTWTTGLFVWFTEAHSLNAGVLLVAGAILMILDSDGE